MRIAPLALALALAGCSAASGQPNDPDPFAPAPAALPGAGAPPLAVAAGEPKDLPGVDTSALVEREKKQWWKLVSTLYAPCSEAAVSIAQCVEEQRACAACAPAARLIAERVHLGASDEQVREVYATRFGPNIKKVEIADSPTRGPADAPVTLVVWSDFECPHCRMFMPVIEAAFEKFTPRVRLVHKFYPLRTHSHAEGAARAAIAALNQGRYWEMERTLFAHQDAQTMGDLERYALDLNLDLQRYRDDLFAKRTNEIIARDRQDADRSGLTGTPFILINGREFDLALFHPDDLEPWIALELELHGKSSTPAQ